MSIFDYGNAALVILLMWYAFRTPQWARNVRAELVKLEEEWEEETGRHAPIEVHIQTDGPMSPETKAALAQMIALAGKAAREGKL